MFLNHIERCSIDLCRDYCCRCSTAINTEGRWSRVVDEEAQTYTTERLGRWIEWHDHHSAEQTSQLQKSSTKGPLATILLPVSLLIPPTEADEEFRFMECSSTPPISTLPTQSPLSVASSALSQLQPLPLPPPPELHGTGRLFHCPAELCFTLCVFRQYGTTESATHEVKILCSPLYLWNIYAVSFVNFITKAA